MIDPAKSENTADTKTAFNANLPPSAQKDEENWAQPKYKPTSFTRPKPVKESKESSEGIQKERIVEPGYLYLKIRMLDEDQILEYFTKLKEEAVRRHKIVYGEKDESYLKATIEVNIITSITEIGQYGHAHCLISNDDGHKMYNIFLGKGPFGDFPRIKTVTNEDGTTTTTSEPFITFWKVSMKPKQVEQWMASQERKFTKGEIEEDYIKALREHHNIYDIYKRWKTASLESKTGDGNLISEAMSAIAIVRVTRLQSEGKSQEELDAASSAYEAKIQAAIDQDVPDHIQILDKDIDELEPSAAYVYKVEIEAEPLFITISAKGTSPGHLYITNDKLPLSVTEQGLKAIFSKYNTRDTEYTRTYPSINGPHPVTDSYPHVWIQTKTDIKGTRRIANIAFSDIYKNDAEYAYHMRRKFKYPLGKNAEGKKVSIELEIKWWDDNVLKPRIERRGAPENSSSRRDYRPRFQQQGITPSDFSSRSGARTPQMATMKGATSPAAAPPKPPISGPTFGPLPGASSALIASMAANKTSQEPVVTQWGSGKLSFQRLLEDEDGNAYEPVMITSSLVMSSGRRGYEPNYNGEGILVRRDDGSLPW